MAINKYYYDLVVFEGKMFEGILRCDRKAYLVY